MSELIPPDDTPSADQDDLLAAEYVLGTLPHPERRAAMERIAVDGAFAAKVAAWEARFVPLNEDYAAAPAPNLLPQIEAQLFGTKGGGLSPSRQRWFASAFRYRLLVGVAAAMLTLAAIIFWPLQQNDVVLRADLSVDQSDLRFAARWDSAAGQLEVTRIRGQSAPEGQDYELWLIGNDGVPRSLGLLREPVTQLAATLTSGVTLAISLEPLGGSPELVPTGPVLVAAPLFDS